ncbi:MAG: sodium-dependent transporter [Endomicrobium sp.]|jgi:NSS family neurotransmitter:Na+ symporter|nr:sodium-dependent transporter [Endomicrobium sp.]
MGSNKDSFSSKWGLIFAAAGSAIGLGNIWLFPYRVGELGGAAFLIPYIICVIVLGIIALVGEMTIGRLTGTGPIGAFKKALEMRGKKGTAGEVTGWICILVALVQAIGYSLVVTWVMRFLIDSFIGPAFTTPDSTQYFNVISSKSKILYYWWVPVTVILSGLSILKGIEKGIEKCCKIMIPAIIVLLFVLTIRVAFLPQASEGYKYLLTPRWEFLINPKTWMLALGQVFYSLSLRGSTMIVYGSYSKKSEDMISSAKNIVFLDTLASIIAALLIIPAAFAFSKDVNSGPALMFITMPEIFKCLGWGQFLMSIFFTAVFFAAFTSLIGMIETIVELLQNKFNMPRTWAIISICALITVMCDIFVVGNLRGVIDILELHLIPLCALASAVFLFWIVPPNNVIEEIQSGHPKPVSGRIIHMGRYVLCSIIITIYILNVLK